VKKGNKRAWKHGEKKTQRQIVEKTDPSPFEAVETEVTSGRFVESGAYVGSREGKIAREKNKNHSVVIESTIGKREKVGKRIVSTVVPELRETKRRPPASTIQFNQKKQEKKKPGPPRIQKRRVQQRGE